MKKEISERFRKVMQYFAAAFIAAAVGASAGAVGGMLFGLYGVAHAWAVMSVAVAWARDGMLPGAAAGAAIGAINWGLAKGTVVKRAVGMLKRMVTWKTIKVLVATLAGMILGGAIGALIEITIGAVRIRPFPDGMFLFASGAMYVATAIGAVFGMVVGVADRISDKVIKRSLGGMISGGLLGVALGMLLVAYTAASFLASSGSADSLGEVCRLACQVPMFTILPAAIFGMPVSVASAAVVERLFGEIPMARNPVETGSEV